MAGKQTPRLISLALGSALLSGAFSIAAAERLVPVEDLTARPAQQQIGTNQAPMSVEQRLQRLERILDNQTLLEVFQRLDQLQVDIQQLRGAEEEQTHQMEGLRKRQRDLYLDIDRRIAAMEQSVKQMREGQPLPPPSPVPGTMTPPMPVAPATGSTTANDASQPAAQHPPASSLAGGAAGQPPVDTTTQAQAADTSLQEQTAYQQALDVLMDGQYDLAITAFQGFIQQYSNGNYLSNAQYWLGEAYYVTRRFSEAEQTFIKVVNSPASSKRADAMLKLGYTYYEQKRWDDARKILEQVKTEYPAAGVASLAERRLESLKSR